MNNLSTANSDFLSKMGMGEGAYVDNELEELKSRASTHYSRVSKLKSHRYSEEEEESEKEDLKYVDVKSIKSESKRSKSISRYSDEDSANSFSMSKVFK